MSTEMPKRRLVGWSQYLETQCAKGIGNSIGVVFESVGYICIMGAILALVSCFQRGLFGFLVGLIVAAFFGGLGALAIWAAMVVLCKTDRIGPVAPITRHNAKHLPEVEILVRGSDRPPTADPEAELLRAVRQGSDSQPEQLLRATQESRRDV